MIELGGKCIGTTSWESLCGSLLSALSSCLATSGEAIDTGRDAEKAARTAVTVPGLEETMILGQA